MSDKEKTMDEYAMTEQDLREEQLQQITGGCGACVSLASERDTWLDKAANFRWAAEGHAARGARNLARMAASGANVYTRIAKAYQMAIDAKHPPALGESSNAVPDINRLRLQ